MRKLISIIFLFTLSNVSFGQQANQNPPFISLFVGDLAILSERFTDYYDSKNELTFGIGFGVPLSRSFTVDASVSYYHKKTTFEIPSKANLPSSLELKQLIYNAGVQVHLMPNRIIGLSFLFGLNYATVSEEWKNVINESLYSLEGSGNFGIYSGASFEINLGRGPVALGGDIKYTYSWNPILEHSNTYRELKYTGGMKIYLTKRWR